VQLTVRGSDEHKVLARLAAVLAQFPLATDEAEPTAPPPVPEGWCRLHDVQMPQHTKDGRSWYSHLIAPNTWCRASNHPPGPGRPSSRARLAMEASAMQTQLSLFADTRAPATRPTTPASPRYEIPIYRIELVYERGITHDHPQFRDSASVARLLQRYLAGADREHFVTLALDRKNKLIGLNTVAIGSLTAAVVHPREVFKMAIRRNAAAVIVAHNHPSGDPHPSQEDKVLTRKLVLAGEALGIQVLDHVVLGHERYHSFKDAGEL
jgi:hypothetical protein